MQKSSMKNKMGNNTSKHVAAAGTYSNTKFRWQDDLLEDLLKALGNFKTVMKFQNKDFNANKLCQQEEVRKEIVKIDERCVEYFGPVS